MSFYNKVDFHSHILTKSYYEYLNKYEDKRPDNFDTPKWSENGHIKLMDKLGVIFAELSLSSPSLANAPEGERTEYARRINNEALEFVAKYPDRLGLFATIPLPDVDSSVKVAEEYLQKSGVDGIGMCTNYNGYYLGCKEFEPLMSLLNEKGTVICVHPTAPAGLPKNVNKGLPIPVMEFLMDTTRTFANLVWTDTFEKYPNIKWIFPHGAAFIPILSDRFNSFSILIKAREPSRKLDFSNAMRHCYFDLAGFSVPKQINDMKKNIPVENFLYGSDCPYTPNAVCEALAGNLTTTVELTSREKRLMFCENSVQLIPRLAPLIGIGSDSTPNAVIRSRLSKRKQYFSDTLDKSIAAAYNILMKIKGNL